jgi:hypothetical protein
LIVAGQKANTKATELKLVLNKETKKYEPVN